MFNGKELQTACTGVKHSSTAMELKAENFHTVNKIQHELENNLILFNQWNKSEDGCYVCVHANYSMNESTQFNKRTEVESVTLSMKHLAISKHDFIYGNFTV